MRGFCGGALFCMGLMLAISAGWKWHSEALMEPDRIQVWDSPTLVLVLREDDCPDRRAGLARWLGEVWTGEGRIGHAIDGPRVALAFLWGDPESVEPVLRGVQALGPGQARQAARALGRAGVTGTPGFVLVDGSGRVLLAEEIDKDGPGVRLGLSLRVAEHLLPRAPSTSKDFDPGQE